MLLDYDEEGDILEVIFNESLHRAEVEQVAYRLLDGFMLYVAVDSMKPVQLTVVNFRRLSELPVIHFIGWKKLKASDRKKLLPILSSSVVSIFFKLDPKTGYGRLANSTIFDIVACAA